MHKILISIGENYFTFPPFLIFLFDTIAAERRKILGTFLEIMYLDDLNYLIMYKYIFGKFCFQRIFRNTEYNNLIKRYK